MQYCRGPDQYELPIIDAGDVTIFCMYPKKMKDKLKPSIGYENIHKKFGLISYSASL